MNGDKKYCFTEQEFWALAGSVGIQKLYGFLPEAEADLKKFDEKTVYQLLFQMTIYIKKHFGNYKVLFLSYFNFKLKINF